MLSLEIDVMPVTNIVTETSLLPFSSYLNHQMYHNIVQKRISPSYFVETNCCLTLGSVHTMDHSKIPSHHCCDNQINLFQAYMTCPCSEQDFSADTHCTKHNIVFHDHVKSKTFCSWNVTFLKNISATEPCDTNECFSNPMYQLSVNNINFNMSADSFEVEFSGGEDDYYVGLEYEINTNDLQGINFSFNPDDDEDVDEDDDGSVIYETSDDEDDFCFQTEIVEVDLTDNLGVTCSCESDIHNTAKKFGSNEYHQRNISKYHKECVAPGKICQNDHHNDMNANQVTSCKSDKRVSFAGKTVHRLLTWDHAYRQCRKGEWVKMANDRAHFHRRILSVKKVLEPILLKKLKNISELPR